MSIDHYENFPVASILLPARLRPAVRDIYRFARTADDIADEGDAKPAVRLQRLGEYRVALQDIGGPGFKGERDPVLQPVFAPLEATVRRHGLPLEPFFDLLTAFEQDVRKTRYNDDAELLDYCRYSANPVGRLMLYLYEAADSRNLAWSDAICTGLQLTNFWQDVAIDWTKNRVYIPRDKLQHHGIGEDYIAANTGRKTALPFNASWNALMKHQVQQARDLLRHGQPLCDALPGRIGFELKLVVHGGLRILERLDELHYDVFFQRPTLGKRDWIRLLMRATMQRG